MSSWQSRLGVIHDVAVALQWMHCVHSLPHGDLNTMDIMVMLHPYIIDELNQMGPFSSFCFAHNRFTPIIVLKFVILVLPKDWLLSLIALEAQVTRSLYVTYIIYIISKHVNAAGLENEIAEHVQRGISDKRIRHDKNGDIFSLGVIMWEVICRRSAKEFCTSASEGSVVNLQPLLSSVPDGTPPRASFHSFLITTHHCTAIWPDFEKQHEESSFYLRKLTFGRTSLSLSRVFVGLIKLASECVNVEPDLRPTIDEVLQRIETGLTGTHTSVHRPTCFFVVS